VEGSAEVGVLVDLIIFKPDFYAAEEDDDAYFTLSDPDWNDHYVQAESDVTIRFDVELTANPDGSAAQVEIGDFELAPIEVVARALRGRRLDDLLGVVRDAAEGRELDAYAPDPRIESDLEETIVLSVYRGGSAELQEILDATGGSYVCHLETRVDADVQWIVTAPSTFDADAFAGLTLNQESGAPIIQDVDSASPLVIDLNATWDAEHGWHAAEINQISLEAEESKRRAARGTRADELVYGLADAEEGDDPFD
jgi:hypothetical protein